MIRYRRNVNGISARISPRRNIASGPRMTRNASSSPVDSATMIKLLREKGISPRREAIIINRSDVSAAEKLKRRQEVMSEMQPSKGRNWEAIKALLVEKFGMDEGAISRDRDRISGTVTVD